MKSDHKHEWIWLGDKDFDNEHSHWCKICGTIKIDYYKKKTTYIHHSLNIRYNNQEI